LISGEHRTINTARAKGRSIMNNKVVNSSLILSTHQENVWGHLSSIQNFASERRAVSKPSIITSHRSGSDCQVTHSEPSGVARAAVRGRPETIELFQISNHEVIRKGRGSKGACLPNVCANRRCSSRLAGTNRCWSECSGMLEIPYSSFFKKCSGE
jgi:hypothetical protein